MFPDDHPGFTVGTKGGTAWQSLGEFAYLSDAAMGVLDVGFRELAMLSPSNSPYAAMTALLLLEVGFEHMCLSRYGAWKA